MGKLGCSMDGNMNEAKFSEPMPWIGIYVAAASLLCAVAMALDTILGFRYRKYWFPCKYFSLNATSLTIIAVAVKFSVDLNTPMPRKEDQLAKLSSAVFICTVMGNSLPSLGNMQNNDLCMNVMALAILVITIIINIGIQLHTGVIFIFWQEHAFIMSLMLALLLKLCFSAITVPTTKKYLEVQYNKRYELAVKEGLNRADTIVATKLKKDLTKYWMMAHTCSPQFVIGRSVTCTASGALCLVSAMILAETMIRCYLMPWEIKFCSGASDYKWSISLVLVTQTIAVGIGTIAPAIRWFTAIRFWCPTRGRKTCLSKIFKLEKYWIQMLLEMKESPLTVQIQNRHFRKIIHSSKNKFLNLCIGMQTGIVFSSKVIQFIAIYIIGRILLFCDCCRELKNKLNCSRSVSNESRSQSQPGSKIDLSRFVLHLEGEDELVELMMKHNCDATDHWMRMGQKKKPRHLIDMLEQTRYTQGYTGVQEFDSDLVPSLDIMEPANCWALPMVTLTTIAITLPGTKSCLTKKLTSGVHEGLKYVKLVEEQLDTNEDLLNSRKAAEIVWLGVDLYHKWLDVDLHKLSLEVESPRELLEKLSDTAKNRFEQYRETFTNHCLFFKDKPSKWPVKVLACNSMYRISQTILLNYQSQYNNTTEKSFEIIFSMISDIMGACLTNLPHVISIKCLTSTVEEREESVRDAVFLLGKTEKILQNLDQKGIRSLHHDRITHINEWRRSQEFKEPQISIPSLSDSVTHSSSSSELSLTIE